MCGHQQFLSVAYLNSATVRNISIVHGRFIEHLSVELHAKMMMLLVFVFLLCPLTHIFTSFLACISVTIPGFVQLIRKPGFVDFPYILFAFDILCIRMWNGKL